VDLGSFNFSMRPAANSTWQIQYIDGLSAGNWTVLTNVSGSGENILITDPRPETPSRFYRAVQAP
jgi:hypothetical protein